MANKAIKDYGTFSGTDGYLIVDGINAGEQGGKKLLSEVNPIPDFPPSYSMDKGILTCNVTAKNIEWENVDHYTVIDRMYIDEPLSGGQSGGIISPVGLAHDNTLELLGDPQYPNERKKLSVKNAVPDPGTNQHRGDVLKVNDSDEIVWGAGGGGASIVIAKVVLQDADDEDYSLNFISETHTVKQLYNLINDGTAIVNVQLTILNVDGYVQEVHLLTAGATRDGESHNVYMVGAGGSGSYTSGETAELLGWWNEGEEAGQWYYLNSTHILYPELQETNED